VAKISNFIGIIINGLYNNLIHDNLIHEKEKKRNYKFYRSYTKTQEGA